MLKHCPIDKKLNIDGVKCKIFFGILKMLTKLRLTKSVKTLKGVHSYQSFLYKYVHKFVNKQI